MSNNHTELMAMHVETLFTHDVSGCLVSINEQRTASAPRIFVGRTNDGILRRFRFDVEQSLRSALERVIEVEERRTANAAAPIDPVSFERLLAPDAERKWLGPAFAFPQDLPTTGVGELVTLENVDVLWKWFADWIPDVHAGAPVVVAQVDGDAVAICCSVRQSARAHEAGVETVPEFRGRGFAVAVVAAWAREVRARGYVPLYSTSWDNGASRVVAKKLGLIQFGSDLHIT